MGEASADDLLDMSSDTSKMDLGKGITGAGLILNGLGTLLKVGAIQKHGAQSKAAYDLSAESALRAAADATQRGQIREYTVVAEGSRVIAEQRAQSSTGALDVNVGAQQATERSSQANLEFNRAVVRRNAALEAYGFRQRAQVDYQEGEYAQEKANSEALGTFLGGVADFVKVAGPIAAGA